MIKANQEQNSNVRIPKRNHSRSFKMHDILNHTELHAFEVLKMCLYRSFGEINVCYAILAQSEAYFLKPYHIHMHVSLIFKEVYMSN